MSIPKPRNRSSGGARVSALATSAMAKTATASRSRREIRTVARRLMPALHAGQAADKRRIARLGVGIDLEHDLLVREFGPVICHSRPLAEKGEMDMETSLSQAALPARSSLKLP